MGHVIKTQVLDVVTNSTEGAFALQQALSNFFYASIFPILEKTFDELAPDQKTITLDRLEIDLGVLTMSDIQKQEWAKLVITRLQRELKTGVLLHTARKSPVDTGISTSAQWIHYMERGYLPWNTINTDKEWFTQALQGFATDTKAIEQLRKLIIGNRVALDRIILLHSQEFLIHLLEVLTARKHENLEKLISVFCKAAIESNDPDIEHKSREMIRTAWKRILHLASASIIVSGNDLLQKGILSYLSLTTLKHINSNIDKSPLLQPYATLIQQELKRSDENSLASNTQPDPVKPEKTSKLSIPEDGLFISHAGLVLLHPFLVRCFAYAGIWDATKFRDDPMHQKAMILLNWMATGSSTIQEHEMVMHKILCGYPLHDPVDINIELTEQDMEIAGGLLDTVIEQWTILKNTSRNGLREQFLNRNGKLITKDGDYRLQVECNTVDVLLDHLPWGIGSIKLPWMPSLLKVEWR
jgi:hypothetical protein